MANIPPAYMSTANNHSVDGFHIPVLNFGSIEFPDPKFGVSILLLGSTRSGKTSVCNYIYKKYFSDFITVLYSNSLQSNAYDMLKKTCLTSDHYHGEILKDQYHINHETNNHYQFLNIIDDCSDTKNCKQMKRLMCLYRNSRISCIVSGQGATMIDKLARSNINYIMLGYTNSSSESERSIKDYLQGYFPTNLKMSEKILLYKKLTSNHQWIVIDNINGVMFLSKLQPNQLLE